MQQLASECVTAIRELEKADKKAFCVLEKMKYILDEKINYKLKHDVTCICVLRGIAEISFEYECSYGAIHIYMTVPDKKWNVHILKDNSIKNNPFILAAQQVIGELNDKEVGDAII